MNEVGRTGVVAMEKLRGASEEMDAVLKEEGFDEHGPLGVFSRYQRLAIEELANIVVGAEEKIAATMNPLCKRIEASAEEFREGQLAELQALFKAGHQVLELAREAAKTAARAQKQTRDEYDQAIVRVAKTMADKLLDSGQRWLVLKQTDYNRRSAWRHAAVVSAAVLALVALGYGYRGWQDGPAAEALERCAAAPIMLKIGDQQQLVPACRLDHLAKRDVKDLPEALREWFAEWLP